MSKVEFEQELHRQLQQLDKHKQPQRDLWPGIEVALVEQSERPCAQDEQRWPKPMLLAASVLLVGVLSWFSLQGRSDQHLSGADLVAQLSQQHQLQKQALLVKFQDQPALTKNWSTQLAELDDAASAIKAALEHDPDNMALLKMLQSVHQQQIDLIERVHSSKWQQI